MSENLSLKDQYQRRFAGAAAYRDGVWKILNSELFARWISADASVLDLGCGWGEFIRNCPSDDRYAMDLNPDSGELLGDGIHFLHQDCSTHWELPSESLDVVFTSNFLEHLPTKQHIERTIDEARRCLKPGGKMILMGPNVRFVPGAYWDFWDHHVALSERSLVELLELKGFNMDRATAQFLPYTMSDGRQKPLFLLRMYLRMPFVWPLFGKQFLVVATRCR